MCQPWEVANLVRRYCQLVEYHIHHLAALTQSVHNVGDFDGFSGAILTGRRLQADELTIRLREENENITARCSDALARTVESEEALSRSRNEFERIKTVLESELAARQARIDAVMKVHELLRLAHGPCANKVSCRVEAALSSVR